MDEYDIVNARTLTDGIHFAETPTPGPDGRVYVSDFYAHEVLAIDVETGAKESILTVPAQPSGLGWLEDGSLLVVSMRDRRVLRRHSDGSVHEYADLSAHTEGCANDMYVAHDGRAWVGDFGFDFYGMLEREPEADPLFGPGANPPTASLVTIDAKGAVRTAATGLRFPNGIVQLGDGRLVVAETVGGCLTAFDVGEQGALANRAVHADLKAAAPGGEPIFPDGTCSDVEDGIWVSDPTHGGAVRIGPDGSATDYVKASQGCFAVGLKGSTLVLCTAVSSNPNEAGASRTGKIEVAQVDVPGKTRV